MFTSASRTSKGVLPSHRSSRAKDAKSKRLSALVRLLGLLCVVALILLAGKAAFSRIWHRSAQAQTRALSTQHTEDEPCTDELCTIEHHQHHHSAVSHLLSDRLPERGIRTLGSISILQDTAAKAKDSKPFTLQRAGVATGLYAMSLEDTDGRSYGMDAYAGQVSLVVNVASKCGYTDSNYKGLQQLYEKYHARGFEVLAFPCNQFGGQEPGNLAEVRDFAHDQYHVTFPLFPKVEVNGQNEHAIFKYLKQNLPGRTGADFLLSWNFNKFLVNRDGMPVKHYKSTFSQQALEQDIEAELDAHESVHASSA